MQVKADVLKRKQKLKKPNGFKKNQTVSKKPNGFEKNQMVLKKPDNDNEDDNEDDNDNEGDTNSLVSKYNENIEKVQQYLLETLGNTNLTVINEAISFLDELPLDVIHEGLLRAARKQKRWDYAKGILDNWVKEGLDSLKKVQAQDLEYKSNKAKTVSKTETDAERKARILREMEDYQKNDTS